LEWKKVALQKQKKKSEGKCCIIAINMCFPQTWNVLKFATFTKYYTFTTVETVEFVLAPQYETSYDPDPETKTKEDFDYLR